MNKASGNEQQEEQIDTTDIPEQTVIFFESAFMSVPIDRDIAAWFYQQGYSLTPKINEVLREYMRVNAATVAMPV